MKKLIVLTLFATVSAFAQTFSEDLDNPDFNNLRQEGQLFTIQISKKAPIRIYVIGKEEATFDPKTLKLFVHRLDGNTELPLTASRRNGYFVLPKDVQFNDLSKLRVRPTSGEKTETFEFKLR